MKFALTSLAAVALLLPATASISDAAERGSGPTRFTPAQARAVAVRTPGTPQRYATNGYRGYRGRGYHGPYRGGYRGGYYGHYRGYRGGYYGGFYPNIAFYGGGYYGAGYGYGYYDSYPAVSVGVPLFYPTVRYRPAPVPVYEGRIVAETAPGRLPTPK